MTSVSELYIYIEKTDCPKQLSCEVHIFIIPNSFVRKKKDYCSMNKLKK